MKLQSSFLAAGMALVLLAGCGKKSDRQKEEAPPPASVVPGPNVDAVTVPHPERFPVVPVKVQMTAPMLRVTGQVQPDVTRVIPVISLASGRILSIHAHLGDIVQKGQLLFTVQSNDIEQAFANYRKAQADAALAKAQLERAQLLYSRGAISQSALEIAQDTSDKAVIDEQAAREHLSVLGVHQLSRSDGLVNVYAPASGIIVQQNVTQAAGVKTLDSSPNLFTIANLNDVWIVCDVYENDLQNLTIGQSAQIHFNAFPDKVVNGRISEIDPILDPSLRTAKVRIQVHNPGFMKIGMFVTAVFEGRKTIRSLVVPASAIIHMHDQDFVYTPVGNGNFRRVRVVSGNLLPDNLQVVQTGLGAGEQVVSNALELQSTVMQ